MNKIVKNPEDGAPIKGFEIQEPGFTGIIDIPAGKAIELPEVAADILLEIFGFLVEDATAIPDNEEPVEEVAQVRPVEEVEKKVEKAKVEKVEEKKKEDEEVSYECGDCGRLCKSKLGLVAHLRSHSKDKEVGK